MFTSPCRQSKGKDGSPTTTFWRTPSMSTRAKSMKTPGLTIPTPAKPHPKHQVTNNTSSRAGTAPKSTGTASLDEFDDTAFLPNYFQNNATKRQDKENAVHCTTSQVRQQIEQAVREARDEWDATRRQELEQENETLIQKMQRDGVETLEEHAQQWEEEQKARIDRMKQTHATDVNDLECKIAEMQIASENLTELMLTASNSQDKYRQEMDDMEARHAKELEDLKHNFERSIQEQDEVKAEQQQELTAKHSEEVELLKQNLRHQCDDASSEITECRRKHEEELQGLTQQHQVELKLETNKRMDEIAVLKADFDASQTQELARIENMETHHAAQLHELKAQFNIERRDLKERETVLSSRNAEMDHEIKSLWETVGKLEKDSGEYQVKLRTELQEKLHAEQALLKQREEEMRLLTSKNVAMEGTIKTLEEIVDKLEKDAAESQEKMLLEFEEKLNAEQAGFIQKEEELVSRHAAKAKSLAETIELLKSSDTTSSKEKDLTEKLAQLEEASKQDKQKHTAEIDEMLAQLDLLEKENGEKYTALEKSVAQKDAIVGALGTQLADATSRTNEIQATLETSRQDLKSAQEELASASENIKTLGVEHTLALEDERTKARAGKELVRKETIAKAEEQFNRANEHYVNLKHEYDKSLEKISKLEKETASIERKVESAKTEGASREAKVSAELCQSKSALAAAEACVAKKTMEFKDRIDRELALQKELQTKLDEVNSKYKTTNSSLASIVAEKERLIKENVDLTAVCDELMTMMEKNPTKK